MTLSNSKNFTTLRRFALVSDSVHLPSLYSPCFSTSLSEHGVRDYSLSAVSPVTSPDTPYSLCTSLYCASRSPSSPHDTFTLRLVPTFWSDSSFLRLWRGKVLVFLRVVRKTPKGGIKILNVLGWARDIVFMKMSDF